MSTWTRRGLGRGAGYGIVPAQTFGHWTVIGVGPERRGTKEAWLCRCRCGTERVINAYQLVVGRSKSCGCRVQTALPGYTTKHGENRKGAPTYLYLTWVSMKRRCYSRGDPSYSNYGGRGIEVHAAWRQDYAAFARYIRAQLGERPTVKHTLDRIDNNRGYEPGNVRWASKSEQVRNTRIAVYLTIDGATRHIREWAALSPVPESTIRGRLKRGWPIATAVFEPIGRRVSLLQRVAASRIAALEAELAVERQLRQSAEADLAQLRAARREVA